ncbi:MAG: hypothetical protein MRY72_12045 [Aquisalinus sp.]|nr:hypothetical protein [Aquisalinus sp.]
MPEPSLELDKPNAVGALDRLTTNVAMSLVCVVPTFFMCLVKPWRLSALIRMDDPSGRSGMLLAPGAYFPLAMLVSLMAGALLTTPEIANNSGAFLGPALALSIQSALAEGDVWKTIAIVMPIFGFAVLAGSLGLVLKKWAHQDWTLRTSLRAVFYVTATLVSWIILSTAALDLIRISSGNADLVNTLISLIPLPTLGLVFWMYLWFFRNGGALSLVRSGILSLAMIAIKIVSVIALGTMAAM